MGNAQYKQDKRYLGADGNRARLLGIWHGAVREFVYSHCDAGPSVWDRGNTLLSAFYDYITLHQERLGLTAYEASLLTNPYHFEWMRDKLWEPWAVRLPSGPENRLIGLRLVEWPHLERG